ncbi:hypothetical protein MSBRW_0003 (plasmid) [Methanosarcina barkeri str. Wiesmoor]|uniref:Glycosyltransferase RgtA/B/C/D-like domain-containing protein n=2 Tax=Methanosarcina barkeri TaxID=2208 RepID=A0A0E3LKC0_METBA|nr:hypothetical protein [Methanosarcina barkeri]AKB49256.1 hypothetical protein MSBRW_0003 [Methanosarcina barkeri str. Wiesmoor]
MIKESNVNKHNNKTSLELSKLIGFFESKLQRQMCSIYKFQLLSTLTSFMLISYSLLLVARKPVMGYEISIYSSTPLIFWVSLLFSLINGMFLLLSSISTRSSKQFNLGFFQIIFCNALLVFLPKLKNYMLIMGRGDNAHYVGYAMDVSIYGHIPEYNFYPYTSVLISQISQILNISALEVSKYIPSLFVIIYMLSIYCWAKSFKQDQNFITYSIIASIPLFFAWFFATIYHMLISTLILPLLFYTLNKNSDFRYRILFIMLCLVLPFTHPIISLVFLSYLTCMFFEEILSNSKPHKVSLRLIMIFLVTASIWYLAQYSLTKNAIEILDQIENSLLMRSSGATTLTVATGYANKLGFLTAAKAFLIMAFDELMYYILSFFSIIFILKNSKKGFGSLKSVSFCFIFGSIFYVFLFVSSRAHTPYRFINLDANMIFTPLLLGYLMVFLRKQYRIVLNLIVLLSVITTVASVYQSPIITYPNDHFTAYDISGGKWLLDTKSENIPTIRLMSSLDRYSSLIYGSNYTLIHTSSVRPWSDFPKNLSSLEIGIFPSNFTRYFLITEYEKQAYSTVWKDVGQFNERDLTFVTSCKNVYCIYDNQELSTYLVKPYDKGT